MPPTWETENNGYELSHTHNNLLQYCHLSAYRSRADDSDAFLVGHLDYLPRLSFGDSLGYDGDGVDLKTQSD